ncbi:MAG: rod shape-determining protein MreC [candidate division WOR-3 bacterium]|nr:MAG: rod shape-determining protein MreC [candidate division WOR-3 bacterium]
MQHKTIRTWQDWLAWVLVAAGLVLLFLPPQPKRAAAVPLQTVLLAPMRVVRALRADVRWLDEENRRLSALAAELAVDNARLRTLARGAAEPPDVGVDLVRAPVIARDLATLERHLVISRGTRHGLAAGSPVVAPEGVVGKVVQAGAHQSLVQTILDPDSRVAVLNRRSRVPALARPGTRHYLELQFAPKGSDFRTGDTLVTAGLGGVFPHGLLVGIVVAAADRTAEMFKSVRVRPFVTISTLEQVFALRFPQTRTGDEDDWLDNIGPAGIEIPDEPPPR